MKTIINSLQNGRIQSYVVVNEIAYRGNTPLEVIKILEEARQNKQEIRIFYGDADTGQDFMEEDHMIGIIGSSSTSIKRPLIISRDNSLGILTDSIVRITIDMVDVYKHPNYHLPTLSIKGTPKHLQEKGYVLGVYGDDGISYANFKSKDKAIRWIKFIKGEINKG